LGNPVVVEVLRGERVESLHTGAGAVCDADGKPVFAFGDIARPVFPRSAVKPIQALPLAESGAADGFSQNELALACASHSGEPEHLQTAAAMLSRAGLDASALACGAHWPLGAEAARALARSGGEPGALHNNCSGKHAGFVCLACAEGLPVEGYQTPAHGVQKLVKAALEDVCGERLGEGAVDGCSIPAYALPLSSLARGFARLATGQGLAPARAAAAKRLLGAMASQPFYVAGTQRFDTQAMTILGGRAVVKTGAEGVYCAALPELGLGVALKIDDGATRAAQVAVAALIARFVRTPPSFLALRRPELTNWRGVGVGALRPAGPLADV
jgi:L-asparaginase II